MHTYTYILLSILNVKKPTYVPCFDSKPTPISPTDSWVMHAFKDNAGNLPYSSCCSVNLS